MAESSAAEEEDVADEVPVVTVTTVGEIGTSVALESIKRLLRVFVASEAVATPETPARVGAATGSDCRLAKRIFPSIRGVRV